MVMENRRFGTGSPPARTFQQARAVADLTVTIAETAAAAFDARARTGRTERPIPAGGGHVKALGQPCGVSEGGHSNVDHLRRQKYMGALRSDALP